MKAGPQSISYKFNCDLDQKPVPRHKIPTDALLEVEGLTAYDTDFVECSYVGQRADEAAGALVAASITANNILFQRDNKAEDVIAKPPEVPKAPSDKAVVICDPTAIGGMSKKARELGSLSGTNGGLDFDVEVSSSVQVDPSKVSYPRGDLGGDTVVELTVPEHMKDQMYDELYAAGSSVAPAFWGRKIEFDLLGLGLKPQVDEEYLEFLVAKLGGRIKVVDLNGSIYIFYELIGMLPSNVDRTIHAEFLSRADKVRQGYQFVSISPSTFGKVGASLGPFLAQRSTFSYDDEGWLEIQAYPNIEAPHHYAQSPGKWLQAVARSSAALHDQKGNYIEASMFTSSPPPPKTKGLSLTNQRVASSELIVMHQVAISNKKDYDTATALHAATVFSRFFEGGSSKHARDLAITALYIANKSSKSFKKMRPLPSVVKTYYNTIYPNNPIREEEVDIIMQKVLGLERKIIESLGLNVVSDHGFWGLRKIKSILGSDGHVMKCLGYAKALYRSGQVLAAGGGWLVGKYDCLTLTTACYLLFDTSINGAPLLLAKMGVSSMDDVEDCANAIVRYAHPLTDRKYTDHVEAGNALEKIGGTITLQRHQVQTQTESIILVARLSGLGPELEKSSSVDKIAKFGMVMCCDVVVDKTRGTAVVKGSERGVSIFLEMLTADFGTNVIVNVGKDVGKIGSGEIKTGTGNTSAIIDVSKVKEIAPEFRVMQDSKFPFQAVADAKLSHVLPLKHGLATAAHLIDMECFRTNRTEDQRDLVHYLLGAEGNYGCQETLELSRWPPASIAVKETLALGKMKVDVKTLGFSPVALHELNLLHRLHTQGGRGGNRCFLMPVGVLRDAERLSDVSGALEDEEDLDIVDDAFDIDALTSGETKKRKRKGNTRRDENKRRISEVKKVIGSDGGRSNGCDENWGLHFVNKAKTHSTMSTLLKSYIKSKHNPTPEGRLGAEFLRGLTLDLLKICKGLHENSTCVGKMNMAGVLIGEDGGLVMGSIGDSSGWKEGDDVTGVKGSASKGKDLGHFLPFAAPEVLLGATKYSPKTDMWLVGSLVTSLALGKHAFSSKDRVGTFVVATKIVGSIGSTNFEKAKAHALYQDYKKKMIDAGGKKYKPGVGKWLGMMLQGREGDWSGFIDLVSKLLVLDPEKRTGADEALRHGWLAGMAAENGDAAGWRGYGKAWLKVKEGLRRQTSGGGAREDAVGDELVGHGSLKKLKVEEEGKVAKAVVQHTVSSEGTPSGVNGENNGGDDEMGLYDF